MRITETAHEWRFDLIGEAVTRVCVDWAAIVLLVASLEIRVQNKCTLEQPDGLVYELDPNGSDPSTLAPVLRLVRQSVAAIHATKNGWLRIDLANGWSLTAPPDVQYEAWQLSDENGASIVCTPGGEPVTWLGRSGNRP